MHPNPNPNPNPNPYPIVNYTKPTNPNLTCKIQNVYS